MWRLEFSINLVRPNNGEGASTNMVHSVGTMRGCRRWNLVKIVLVALLLLLASVVPTFAIDAEQELGIWIGATSALRYSDQWSLFLQGDVWVTVYFAY